jgi:fucose 4-O-acetylase-like acetyltransferase
MSSVRIGWIDIAKGIAIILVIFGHTFIPGSLWRDVIFSFHMPLFFILAGYTFKLRPLGELAQRSFPQLIIPFLLTFLVCQIILGFSYQSQISADYFLKTIGSFVWSSGYLYEPLGIPAVGMIWFLVCLFFSRLGFAFFMQTFESYKTPEWIRGLCFVLLAGLGVSIGSLLNIYLPFSLDLALVAQLFLYVGWVFKKYQLSERFGKFYLVLPCLLIWVLAILFGKLEMATRAYWQDGLAFLMPLSFAGAVTGTMLCCWVAQLIEKYLPALRSGLLFVGKATLLILCLHAIEGSIITWTQLALFQSIPMTYFAAGLVRTLFLLTIVVLIDKVAPKNTSPMRA